MLKQRGQPLPTCEPLGTPRSVSRFGSQLERHCPLSQRSAFLQEERKLMREVASIQSRSTCQVAGIVRRMRAGLTSAPRVPSGGRSQCQVPWYRPSRSPHLETGQSLEECQRHLPGESEARDRLSRVSRSHVSGGQGRERRCGKRCEPQHAGEKLHTGKGGGCWKEAAWALF